MTIKPVFEMPNKQEIIGQIIDSIINNLGDQVILNENECDRIHKIMEDIVCGYEIQFLSKIQGELSNFETVMSENLTSMIRKLAMIITEYHNYFPRK